jgi:hypothetical protein
VAAGARGTVRQRRGRRGRDHDGRLSRQQAGGVGVEQRLLTRSRNAGRSEHLYLVLRNSRARDPRATYGAGAVGPRRRLCCEYDVLGSVYGILANAEASGTSASIVVSDPQSKQSRIANVTATGRIMYAPFETTIDPSAKMAIVAAGPMRGVVAARRDEMKMFRSTADRVAVKDGWSFKDAHNRVAHVRGVRTVDLGGKPYVIVETHLVALRGLDVPGGVNNASRISLIPID